MEGARHIFHQTATRIHARINEKLAQEGVDTDVTTDLVNPFSGLESQCLQEKYFAEKLSVIVSL